jgi:hypothetical protein
MRRALLLIVLTAALIGCGGAAPTATMTGCATSDGKQVYGLLETYSKNWTSAGNKADDASPATLGPEIENLRSIRNDLSGQKWPACGKAAQDAFVAVMDETIKGFTAIQQQKPKAESDAIFERARTLQETFKAEVLKLPH